MKKQRSHPFSTTLLLVSSILWLVLTHRQAGQANPYPDTSALNPVPTPEALNTEALNTEALNTETLTVGQVWPEISAERVVPLSAEEIPEEILRNEIITEARSPIDGSPLTAAEYAQLEADLAVRNPAIRSERIRYIIFLLQVRRAVRPIVPFL